MACPLHGVAYGGGGSYKAMDCQLQDSRLIESQNCDGAHHNLDLYVSRLGKFGSLRNDW